MATPASARDTLCAVLLSPRHAAIPISTSPSLRLSFRPRSSAAGPRKVSSSTGLRKIPGSLEDANCTGRLSHETGARWVVVDGYQFSPKYLRRLKELGCAVLSIDDCGYAGPYCADVVLNQNAYADKSFYPESEASTRLLLGLRYLLLRREFRERAGHRERATAPRAAKLLVTLGGSDPDNAARTVLEFLAVPERRFSRSALYPGSKQPARRRSIRVGRFHFTLHRNRPRSHTTFGFHGMGRFRRLRFRNDGVPKMHTSVSPFSLSPSLITSGSSAIAGPPWRCG